VRVSPLTPETFADNARAALADATLTGALRRATDTFAERRAAAIDAVPDWQDLRTRAAAIKAHTLARLDGYLAEFAANATKAGATVHWARDAAEACAVVRELAKARGSKRLVKSKSMATEEIHLNAALRNRSARCSSTSSASRRPATRSCSRPRRARGCARTSPPPTSASAASTSASPRPARSSCSRTKATRA